MDNVSSLIEKLYMEGWLRNEEFLEVLIHHGENEMRSLLAGYTRRTVHRCYGNKVYTRGLVEFSSYCRNGCYYCGICRGSSHARRYRLREEDIFTCCDEGYNLGFRTFVLQSGEDGYYTDELLIEIITDIKWRYPDCAITLSPGKKEKESYQCHYDVGTDRYPLCHETSNVRHYRCLHPKELTSEYRKQCLRDLKAIGLQTGCGIMVGPLPQTLKHIVEDLHFMKELQPKMVGIGPFPPHHDTSSHNEPAGSPTLTLTLLSIIRLILSNVLLPVITALDTIGPQGKGQGILVGADIVIPNLSPVVVRKKYIPHDDRICTDDKATECRVCLPNRMKCIEYELITNRSDSIRKLEEKCICTISIY